MSTRKERYAKMRRKHQNKLRRWRNCGYRWTPPGVEPHGRVSRRWFLPTIGFMDNLRLISRNVRAWPLNHANDPTLVATVEVPGGHRWPIARLTGPVADLWHSRTWNERFAFHGYRLRPLRLFGRLPGRMTVWQRRCWAANWFFMNNGYFRDDDPAGRHPSASDVDGGTPIVTMPTWPGIPPAP